MRFGISLPLLAIVCLSLLAPSGGAASPGEVTPYPRPPYEAADPDHLSVTVNGVPVETVGTTMNVGYVHFAFTGAARVEITMREPVKSFELSPKRLGLRAEARGNVLAFDLAEPRKLHLRVNGLRRFFVFADAPEKDAPKPGAPGVYSLEDYGVTSSPDDSRTADIQRAIDDVAARRGVLFVPPGVYRAGRLELRGGLSLYLAPGAIICGTGRMADYPRVAGRVAQLNLVDDADVRIFGRGVIDGNGQALRRDGGNTLESRVRLFVTLRSRNLVVEDVILREAGSWGVHMIESEDMRFSGVKLVSMTRAEHDEAGGPFYGTNTDGFDPDNSSRIRIEDCFISCDDDGIAVKLTGGKLRDSGDIRFSRNVVWTMCSALKIGTEIAGRTISDVVFEDNDVVHADVGIAVWCWRGGTVENARWINNHFEAIGVVPKESPHKKETNIRLTIRNVQNHGAGHIRNLLIKDNVFARHSPNDSMLQGFDDEHLIDGVVFDNLVIAGQKRTDADDARMTVSRFTENIEFK